MRLEGTYTALVTPFSGGENNSDKVDYKGLEKNIAFQLKGGVDGIVPLGTTGEAPNITKEERRDIIKLVVAQLKGTGKKVMIGTGSSNMHEAVAYTSQAKDLGADAALVVAPYYIKPNQEGLFGYYCELSRVGIPIVVYNIAARAGVNIETSTLERIAQLPNVIGVKEASGDMNQIKSVIYKIQNNPGYPNFSVMSGDDKLTYEIITNGGRGLISVVSNILPQKVSALVKASRGTNIVDLLGPTRMLNDELLPIFNESMLGGNPASIKYMMNLLKMPAGGLRKPLHEISEEHKKEIEGVMREKKLIN